MDPPVKSKMHADGDPRDLFTRSRAGGEDVLFAFGPFVLPLSTVLVKAWHKRKPPVATGSSFLT